MLPTGADLMPGRLSRPGTGSKPLPVLLVHSANTSCELRLGQPLEAIFTLHPPTPMQTGWMGPGSHSW